MEYEERKDLELRTIPVRYIITRDSIPSQREERYSVTDSFGCAVMEDERVNWDSEIPLTVATAIADHHTVHYCGKVHGEEIVNNMELIVDQERKVLFNPRYAVRKVRIPLEKIEIHKLEEAIRGIFRKRFSGE